MTDSITIHGPAVEPDEVDLRIVNALQIQPRAPWNLVGEIAGVSAATAARRWALLEHAGIAWVTSTPPATPTTAFAVIEVSCTHGFTLQVAAQLSADPDTATVAVHAGARDILVDLMSPTGTDLSNYVLERLGGLTGIREVRTHPVIGSYTEGNNWHLGLVSASDEKRLRSASNPLEARFKPRGTRRTMHTLTATQRQVAAVLESDPRVSIAALASSLGTSPATARRRLDATLLAQPLLRCQIAPDASGWPVRATYFLRCPADQIDSASKVLARTPEVRAVFVTVGPNNLFVATSLRSLQDIGRFETHVATRLPHVTVTDRSLEIRLFKMVGGNVLDRHGRLSRRVPYA